MNAIFGSRVRRPSIHRCEAPAGSRYIASKRAEDVRKPQAHNTIPEAGCFKQPEREIWQLRNQSQNGCQISHLFISSASLAISARLTEPVQSPGTS